MATEDGELERVEPSSSSCRSIDRSTTSNVEADAQLPRQRDRHPQLHLQLARRRSRRNLLAFGERFPAHARIVLGRNFRSRAEILEPAAALHRAQRSSGTRRR